MAVSRLDGLHAAGKSSCEAFGFATQWRRWAQVVTPHRQMAWQVRVDVAAVSNGTGMLHRVNAATKLRDVAEALGPLRVRLLETCLLLDAPWRRIAERLRCSDKAVVAWTVEAIEALADHLDGRTVTPPPVLRVRNHQGSL